MEEYTSLIRELEKRRNRLNYSLAHSGSKLNDYRNELSHGIDLHRAIYSGLIEQEGVKMADIQSTLTQVKEWLDEAKNKLKSESSPAKTR
jgi:hypothetical protein